MEKNVLEDIDDIKKERKISKEVEKKILKKTIVNGAIGVIIMLLVMAFYIFAKQLTKDVATLIYNTSAIIILALAIAIIEIAYKKDSGKLAITGIEMLVLSVYALFAPFVFIRVSYKYIYGFIALTTIYYTFKIIRVSLLEQEKYTTEISDITDIIKKESKDEFAKQEKEKREEEQRKLKEQEKAKNAAKKTTTKKTTATRKTTTKKTSTTARKSTIKKSTSTRTTKAGAEKENKTTTKSKTAKKTGTTRKTAAKKTTTTNKKQNIKQGE